MRKIPMIINSLITNFESQINADKRRYVNLHIQRSSEVYPKNDLLISPQRAQSSAISVKLYEKATTSRFRTQMTRIARIFTDPRASASSAQSVFYRRLSAFICVHLRLIFVSLIDIIQGIQFKLFPIINENGFFAPFAYWYEKKLATNPTASNELTSPEFVLVRISSLLFSFNKNHRDLREHREKWQSSAFSVYSVVDCLCNNPTRKLPPNIFNDIKKVKAGVNLT